MGPGFTPAFPFTTVKSIRTVGPHVRENENGKEQCVDEHKGNSNTEGAKL